LGRPVLFCSSVQDNICNCSNKNKTAAVLAAATKAVMAIITTVTAEVAASLTTPTKRI